LASGVVVLLALSACSSSQASGTAATTTTVRHEGKFTQNSPSVRAAYRFCRTFQRKHFPHDRVDAASGPNSTSADTVCDILDAATPCPYKFKGVTVSVGTTHEFWLRPNGSIAIAVPPFRECPPKPS
jgi:hypothetical protein